MDLKSMHVKSINLKSKFKSKYKFPNATLGHLLTFLLRDILDRV